MKLNVVAFAALSALALAACKPADTASPTTATPAAPAPAPETIAPAASGDTVAAGTGVPECDKYLEKVYACISDKVPEAQRDMMKKGIEQSKLSWSTVTDKGALAAQCSTAMEQAKASFGAIGCSF